MTNQPHTHFILPSGFTLCDELEHEEDAYVRMPIDVEKATEITKICGFCGTCWAVWLSLIYEVRNADYESL